MTLKFTPQAFRDLAEMDAYLTDRSPTGLRNVIAALRKTFELIENNAGYGRSTPREGVRVAIEPTYRYVIPYYVYGSNLWVLRVYHPRRAPLDYWTLELPSA
jgi:plasmid stabilization system protein ParE